MINDWNNKSKDFEPMNYQEVEVDDRFGDEIDVEESTPNLDLEKYRESIKASEAFRWLIAEMCCSIVLSTPDPNVRAEVRAVVLDVFPAPRHLSRHSLAPVYHASFAMDWDVLGFLREQYEDDPSYAVETAITLTGTIQEAQALTCRQYLEQTWPRIGSVVVQLLKDSVETAAETSSSGKNSVANTIRRIESDFIFA
jgi:hypothetical protein